MPVASDPSGDARSFFAAFEKLGLKLVKVKDVPVDVLVIKMRPSPFPEVVAVDF